MGTRSAPGNPNSYDSNGNLLVSYGGTGASAGPIATARLLSAAASVNATLVQAGASQLFGVVGYNAAAANRFLKFYDRVSAPTVGTTVPVLTILWPPLSALDLNFDGLSFALGLGYGLTTAAADADTGALTAADILCLNITYR